MGLRGSLSILAGIVYAASYLVIMLTTKIQAVHFYVFALSMLKTSFHIVNLSIVSTLLPMAAIGPAICILNSCSNLGKVVLPLIVGKIHEDS